MTHLFIRRLGLEGGAREALYAYDPRVASLPKIARFVEERWGLAPGELQVQNRRRRVSWPRQEFMWLAYSIPKGDRVMSTSQPRRYSMPVIAAHLGLADHTTVVHGIRTYQRRLESGEIAAMLAAMGVTDGGPGGANANRAAW